ncbi:MAG: porin, partial [Methylophagaceae bacterium]
MNNFKKVGLSALAGSLAMFSANAVEYAVTGDAQVVYSTQDQVGDSSTNSSGKGLGVDTDLYFNASGELDNGFTVSVFTALDLEQSNTATSGGINSSAQLTIGMGSLGTIQFNDVFGSAATSIDDVMPKAYEEPWDGSSHAASTHSFGSYTQSGSVDYRSPAFSLGGGLTIDGAVTYDPNAGVGPAAAGGVASTAGSGEAAVIKIASDTGLTIGGGLEEVNGAALGAGVNRSTVYALYSMGPISLGYQETYVDSAHDNSAVEGADIEADMMGIAITSGDFSVSYAEQNETTQGVSDSAALLEVEMSAIQAAYSMGAMTAAISMYETDNVGGITAATFEETEIS